MEALTLGQSGGRGEEESARGRLLAMGFDQVSQYVVVFVLFCS